MIEATIYSADTGRILRTLRCVAESDLHINIADTGEQWLPGLADARTHYIRDGRAVPFPPRPGPWAAFDFASQAWVDPRTAADLAAELAAAKALAVARINAASARLRAAWVTDIPGQDMLYLRKEAEAARWVSDPAPDLGRYPLIAAEIGITGQDGAQVAQVWLNMAAMWTAVAASLETARLGCIALAEAAGATEEALAAVDDFRTRTGAQ